MPRAAYSLRPTTPLRVADRFRLDAEGKIVEQENHFDAYVLFTQEGPVLIDPVAASPGVEAEPTGLLGQRLVATVLTSSWHERATYAVRERDGTPEEL